MNEEEGGHTKIFKAVVGFTIIDLAFYLVLLLVALYITARFLVWHKKGKIIYVSAFYALTATIVVAKIAFLITTSTMVTYVSDRIALSSKLFLELFQIASMAELSIHIKVSAFKLTPEEAKKKLHWVKIWLSIAVFFYLALNLLEAFALYVTVNLRKS